MKVQNRIIKSLLILLLASIFIIINKNYSYGGNVEYTFGNNNNSNNINPWDVIYPNIGLENLRLAKNLFCVDHGSNLGWGTDWYYVAGAEKNDGSIVYNTETEFGIFDGELRKSINFNKEDNKDSCYNFFKIAYITAGGNSSLYGSGYSNSGGIGDYTYRQQALYKEWNDFAIYSVDDSIYKTNKIFTPKSNNNSASYSDTAKALCNEAYIYAKVMTNGEYKEVNGSVKNIQITYSEKDNQTEISIKYTGILTYLYIGGEGSVDASVLESWGVATEGSEAKRYTIKGKVDGTVSAWAASTNNPITIWSLKNSNIYVPNQGSYDEGKLGQNLIGVDGTISRRRL